MKLINLQTEFDVLQMWRASGTRRPATDVYQTQDENTPGLEPDIKVSA